MKKQPYTQLYTPRNNPALLHAWVPGRAHDEAVIAERRADPEGSLILKLQAIGLCIGQRTMQLVRTRQDIESAHKILAPAYHNSGSATLERRTNKARSSRTINDLYQIARPDVVHRDSPAEVRTKTLYRSNTAARLGKLAYDEFKIGNPTNHTLYKAGRFIGNTGLAAGLVADMRYVMTGTDFEIQNQVRESGMTTLAVTHELAEAISVAPTIAQLADRNSPLVVHWNNAVTNGAYDALRQAQEEFYIPTRW